MTGRAAIRFPSISIPCPPEAQLYLTYKPDSTRSLRLLPEAAEILHAHAHGLFHTRVLHAARLLFEDRAFSFETLRGPAPG